MIGHLSFIILMFSFHEIKAQALAPPTLTVSPAVITETDSVLLNCQPPSSVLPVDDCIFYMGKENIYFRKQFCQSTLTGAELLQDTGQRSPAEVNVKCYYRKGHQTSATSRTSSINILTLAPPTLTVSPAVITETDSVLLNCQPPSSVFPVDDCSFYMGKGNIYLRKQLCQSTLTGAELLQDTGQRSPAEVEVKCYYRKGHLTSATSRTSSINISLKPQITLHHDVGEQIVFVCSLPGSAKSDTTCNLYFGEESRNFLFTSILKETSGRKQRICKFYVPVDDFLTHLQFVQQKDASCDYRLGSEANSLSPRSDRRSVTDILEIESYKTEMMQTSRMTTGLSVVSPNTFTSTTPVKPTSGRHILKSVIVVMGCGVFVAVIFLGSALLYTKKRKIPLRFRTFSSRETWPRLRPSIPDYFVPMSHERENLWS